MTPRSEPDQADTRTRLVTVHKNCDLSLRELIAQAAQDLGHEAQTYGATLTIFKAK